MVEKTTNNQGKASFDVEYGDYDVTVTGDGIIKSKETVQFRSNHKNFTIQVEKYPQITITVTDSNNNPLEGIKVTCWNYETSSERFLDEVLTDSNGQAKGFAPTGTHDVKIYDPNDNDHWYDSTITVTENDKEFTLVWTYRENGREEAPINDVT